MPEARSNLPSAFTLIELLAGTLILTLLFGLVTATISHWRDAADLTVAVARMREIGLALHAATRDRQGTLPGPLWPGQVPIADPTREGRLVNELAAYLDYELPSSPELISFWVPPAFERRVSHDVMKEPRTFVVNMLVADGSGAMLNPWGNLAQANQQPLRLALVPSTAWAMSDADQQHPRVRNAPWRNFTPARPIHGAKRLVLTFGGSVMPLQEAMLELPSL